MTDSGCDNEYTVKHEIPSSMRTLYEQQPEIYKKVDELDNLVMFTSLERDVIENDDVRRLCRGVVFENDRMVYEGVPFTTEIVHDYNNETKNTIETLFTKYTPEHLKIYNAYEGTLLRLFHFNDKWYITTSKRLDAFKSRWGGKQTYGQILCDALRDENRDFARQNGLNSETSTNDDVLRALFTKLNPRKTYTFLVLSTDENRLVCEGADPTVLHIDPYSDEDLGIVKPTPLNFNNADELLTYVDSIVPLYNQGVMIFAPSNRHYKVLNKKYYELFQLRNNEPSVKYRYLHIRTDTEALQKYVELYPEHKRHFDLYEKVISDIGKRILRSYINRYMLKHFIIVAPQEYYIMRRCHTWHVSDREHNKVTLPKVMEEINNLSPSILNGMIKRELGIIRVDRR